MNQIESVPNSLREQLVKAQNFLDLSQKQASRGNYDMAEYSARLAAKTMREVARQNPELGALLIGAHLGYRGIEIVAQEQRTTDHVVDRKFLGMNIGYNVVPITTTVTIRKTARFY